ncbi:MAG: Mur ligase family protein, partial [Gemmatimonadaceae bacterium]
MSFVSPVATDILRAALEHAGELVAVRGALPTTIATLVDDSRQVGPGGCFVAVRGAASDGHAYLSQVQDAGAACVIVEEGVETSLPALVVRHSRIAAAVAAAAFYGEPARSLRIVGVTGTNGKSTTVGILRHLLDEPAGTAASIGTLGVLVGSEGRPLPGGQGLTTPGPIELQRVLRALVEAGVTRVAMECSSHALDQDRVRGIAFDAAVFTNLTRDHLDYHGTMEAYRDAKARLVALLGPQGVCVSNADDRWWDGLPPAPRRLTFGLAAPTADIRVEGMALTPRGSTFRLVTPAGVVAAARPRRGA